MIKVRAIIELLKGEKKRKTPFKSGYRPLFEFSKGLKTSGQITLIDRKEFKPGDTGNVEIQFLSHDFLGKDFGAGSVFQFFESEEALGEGEIVEILQKD